ncbi:hypothetical protein TomTYG75_12460 [Sphingobium sp. TomTYG75]
MPKGTWHVETGILRIGQWGYALERDDGGTWQLDAPRSARRYLDRRVTVKGRRSGFDLLDVHRICPGDGLRQWLPPGWSALFGRFSLG